MEADRWPIKSFIVGILLAAVISLLSGLGFQLARELKRLESAPSDNVQWFMAQVQVELLVLQDTVDRKLNGDDIDLNEIRQRFDILYSRVVTIRDGANFSAVMSEPQIINSITAIMKVLDDNVIFIDSNDVDFLNHLPRLSADLRKIQVVVREFSLGGVAIFAKITDSSTKIFLDLLLKTSFVAVTFIVALLIALAMLVNQYRISRRRAEQLQNSNRRYASVIRVSNDPIIVSDVNGHILDFNPAAERAFGYTREGVIGKNLENLIIPSEYRSEFRQLRCSPLSDAQKSTVALSRIEIPALRAGGEQFEAEFSMGMSEGAQGTIVVTYIRDISARIRFQTALTQARDEALAAAQAKANFLAVMSHEMRTPLNGVMGILDLLKRTRLSPKQQHYLETAITSGEILQRHVDDVLDITQMEAGASKLKPIHFDVGDLLREVQSINQPAAQAKGDALIVETEPVNLTFIQDRHRLRQILMNLVGNAIKFTTNGSVTIEAITVTRDDGEKWLRVTVSDTGIGIASDDKERIFDDFIMLDPSYKRVAPGTGLGLGICRRVVQMLGGKIGVESVPQKGSSFWFELPGLKQISTGKNLKKEMPKESNFKAYRLSVLLVEDNPTNRLVAAEMLRLCGCMVTEAEDGEQGYKMAMRQRFDLILMDVSMPNLDGISATKFIRSSNGSSKDTVIIGLTAHALPEEIAKLHEAGMQYCLVKPLRERMLNKLLERIASGKSKNGKLKSLSEAGRKRLHDYKLINNSIMKELKKNIDPEILDKQLDRFCNELLDAQSDFDPKRILDAPAEHVAEIAHKQAGSAAVFGAIALQSALFELEQAAKNGVPLEFPPLAQRVCDLAKKTRQALLLRIGRRTKLEIDA